MVLNLVNMQGHSIQTKSGDEGFLNDALKATQASNANVTIGGKAEPARAALAMHLSRQQNRVSAIRAG